MGSPECVQVHMMSPARPRLPMLVGILFAFCSHALPVEESPANDAIDADPMVRIFAQEHEQEDLLAHGALPEISDGSTVTGGKDSWSGYSTCPKDYVAVSPQHIDLHGSG